MQLLVDYFSAAIQFFYVLTAQIGVPNYGLAIIGFTIAVKLVLLPLTLKQLKAMRKMQELQPKVKEIQKKLQKQNPQKAQQEIMQLYQKHGANPLGGCLPLLIQMPILWGLFIALRQFFDVNLNPGLVAAHANLLNISAIQLGLPDPYYVLPVLAAVATFSQQWVTMRMSGSMDQTQKSMMYVMPFFMGYISLKFPAGLALYWVVYSIASTGEQFLLRREKVAVVKEEIEAK